MTPHETLISSLEQQIATLTTHVEQLAAGLQAPAPAAAPRPGEYDPSGVASIEAQIRDELGVAPEASADALAFLDVCGQSRRPNTQQKYGQRFQRWADFARDYGFDPTAAEPVHVVLFLGHLVRTGRLDGKGPVMVTTLDQILASIRDAHARAGQPDPTADVKVRTFRAGYTNMFPQQTRRARSIERHDLATFIEHLLEDDVAELAAVTLAMIATSEYTEGLASQSFDGLEWHHVPQGFDVDQPVTISGPGGTFTIYPDPDHRTSPTHLLARMGQLAEWTGPVFPNRNGRPSVRTNIAARIARMLDRVQIASAPRAGGWPVLDPDQRCLLVEAHPACGAKNLRDATWMACAYAWGARAGELVEVRSGGVPVTLGWTWSDLHEVTDRRLADDVYISGLRARFARNKDSKQVEYTTVYAQPDDDITDPVALLHSLERLYVARNGGHSLERATARVFVTKIDAVTIDLTASIGYDELLRTTKRVAGEVGIKAGPDEFIGTHGFRRGHVVDMRHDGGHSDGVIMDAQRRSSDAGLNRARYGRSSNPARHAPSAATARPAHADVDAAGPRTGDRRLGA